MPKINGHLLSALLLCAIFTTPALSVGYEYSCGCGSDSYLYNSPMCTSSSQTNCIVEKDGDGGFTYRNSTPAGEQPCSFCGCYDKPSGGWQFGDNGTVYTETVNWVNYDSYRCWASSSEPAKTYGCDNGYYGLRYIGSGSYACTKCPYGPTSIDGIIMHPSTGAGTGATDNDITDCYIVSGQSSGLKFDDGTGIFTLNGDCYY